MMFRALFKVDIVVLIHHRILKTKKIREKNLIWFFFAIYDASLRKASRTIH